MKNMHVYACAMRVSLRGAIAALRSKARQRRFWRMPHPQNGRPQST